MTTDTPTAGGRPGDAGLPEVMGERRHLINLAYRLLGSAAEAEDAVQEAVARWYALSDEQRANIRSPGGWLTTVTSRICLDLLGTARARRERYVGEWVPEPVPQTVDWVSGGDHGSTSDPADRVTLDESVTMAFLVSLESMTPAERVALILHDVFGYPFPEVATVVGRTPGACRQLASSARHRARSRTSGGAPTTRSKDAVQAFKSAWEARDIRALLRVLDPDATAVADSNGLTQAALVPVEGATQVARHYLMLADRAPADITITESVVNGQPGLVVQHEGSIVTVLAFDVADDRITRIWAVLNPDKLRLWSESRR